MNHGNQGVWAAGRFMPGFVACQCKNNPRAVRVASVYCSLCRPNRSRVPDDEAERTANELVGPPINSHVSRAYSCPVEPPTRDMRGCSR